MKDAGASRRCGLLGLIAALGMGASDLLMLARPVSGHEFVQLGIGNLALIPEGRLTAGAVLGVLFSALYVPGFWHVAQATDPAVQRPAFVMFCLFCATSVFGAAFHAAHAFVGIGLQAAGSILGGVPANGVAASFDALMKSLSSLGAVALLGGSVFFAILVAARRSQYPRWLAVCSPFVLVLGCAAMGWLAPEPLGGYLWPLCLLGAVGKVLDAHRLTDLVEELHSTFLNQGGPPSSSNSEQRFISEVK
jgi:hypothetical protein